MDATDHENIPAPGENSGFSSWMHIGFDYLKHEVETQRSLVQTFGQRTAYSISDKTGHIGKRQSESYISAGNSKMNHYNSKFLKSANEDSGLESSGSTNSSPAASPQGSPLSKRKVSNSMLVSNSQAVSCYNPISWICKGFFSQESDALNSSAKVSALQRAHPNSSSKSKSQCSNSGRRKYIITNFDINALSPQSW